jgi:hypothetical protein
VKAHGQEVHLIGIVDVGEGWLEVQMGCNGRKWGWYEHKSRREQHLSEDDWIAYLADQAVGLMDSGALPLN